MPVISSASAPNSLYSPAAVNDSAYFLPSFSFLIARSACACAAAFTTFSSVGNRVRRAARWAAAAGTPFVLARCARASTVWYSRPLRS